MCVYRYMLPLPEAKEHNVHTNGKWPATRTINSWRVAGIPKGKVKVNILEFWLSSIIPLLHARILWECCTYLLNVWNQGYWSGLALSWRKWSIVTSSWEAFFLSTYKQATCQHVPMSSGDKGCKTIIISAPQLKILRYSLRICMASCAFPY